MSNSGPQRCVCLVMLQLLFGVTIGFGDDARTRRLEYLKARLAQFDVDAGDPARRLTSVSEPVLRWSNPVRQKSYDGAVFLWLDGKRPVGVACLYLVSESSDLTEGQFVREFATLSAERLVCRRNGSDLWTPTAAPVADRVLEAAEPPAPLAPARLSQMRRLARRFDVTTTNDDGVTARMRLLPQPVHRYEDSKTQIIDGALFAFAESNDPEALIVIEAVSADAGSVWRYSVARMNTSQVTVRLDNVEILSTTYYWRSPRLASDPYDVVYDGTFTLSTAP